MRLIDADNLRGRICEIFLCADPGSAEERRFVLVLGLIDSENTIAPPPNDPLTLEELREMDGEPVWITAKGIGRYDVYQGCANRCLEQFYKAALPSSSYGTDWLAYRRRPEEGNK